MLLIKRITIITILLLLISGCNVFPEEDILAPPIIEPKEVTYKTIIAEKGNIENVISVRGSAVPIEFEYIYLENDGNRLESMEVKVGRLVEEGDILFKILTEDLVTAIDRQKISIDTKSLDLQVTKEVFTKEWAMEEGKLEEIQAFESQRNVEEQKDYMEIKKLNYTNTINTKENALALDLMALEDLQERLENAYVLAPRSGRITYIRDLENGDYINAYDKIITIADISSIRVQYIGPDAKYFEVGQKVRIENFDGVGVAGTVSLTPSSVPEEEEDKYINTVFVEFDESLESTVIGNALRLKLVLEEASNVIVIPKSLIVKSGTDRILYVLVDGIKQERYVTLGIESGVYLEILEGIEEGELIIVN